MSAAEQPPRRPYAELLGSRDPEQVIVETPSRLARVLDALTPEQVEARSAPGKWNVREIMAHLADCEIVWSWRLRYALEQDWARNRAQMQPFDQDAWARTYDRYTLAEAKALFAPLRAWNVTLIGGLSEADKSKPVMHPERGEETLWTIVQIMAGHDLHHLLKLEQMFPAR